MNAYIINTETMQWPIYEGDYKLLFPNTSFPSPVVPDAPYAWVQSAAAPAYDWMTHGCREVTPQQVDGQWTQQWEVYELTPEQVAANQESMRQQNKAQAESLLQQIDWTATVDVANPQYRDPYLGNQESFLQYRSELSKIALNPPIIVSEWPTKPDEVWTPAA